MKFPLLFIVVVNLECISSEIYETIFWVPQNRLFDKRSNNCTLELKVKQASTAYFMCPNRGIILQPRLNALLPGNMYENMWVVTNEKDFNNCNATNAISAFECADPEKLNYHTVPFNPYSPGSGGGLSFSRGQKYFFFATSDGTLSNNNNRVGGRCSGKDNITMKFEVYVCNGSRDEECNKDVGVLKCKGAPTEVPPTTTTGETVASSENSCKTAPTATNAEKLPSVGELDSRKSSCDDKSTDNEKQLMLVIVTLAAILSLVIVLFFFLLYQYMNKGKSDRCFLDLWSNRISTQSSAVYNKKAMEEDNADDDCGFENKVLDKENSPQETEEGQTKDKNRAGPIANGNSISNQAQTQTHPVNISS